MTDTHDSDYVDLVECCRMLHCSERTARRLITRKRVKATKVGRRVLVQLGSIRALLASGG